VQATVAGLLLFALYLVWAGIDSGPDGGPAGTRGRVVSPSPPSRTPAGPVTAPASDSGLASAFRVRRSNVEVVAAGRVTRLLPDDRTGSPHQRFVVKVTGGPTVLVAHNLALASRVPLAEGDSVELQGVYEWNERGGVIHWTHRDPEGRHAAGWIRHRGRLYW
jgi:hypothetical protein